MKTDSKAIELCGHHLDPLKHVHEVSREEFFRTLNEDPYQENIPRKTSWVPYVESPNDPFMKVGYDDLRGILKNPEQKIVLIADRPDFICSACPPRVKEACVERAAKQKKGYRVFGVLEQESQDSVVARKFGLELGVPYDARQVREALGLETI